MKRLIWTSIALLLLCACSLAQVPQAGHVFVVLEENHSYSSVIGSSSMPYLNSLAAKYGLATQYYANTHPSIGNYFMLTTGQIITNNDGYMSTVNADNIVRHLMVAGKNWKSYAESLPYAGYVSGDVYPYSRHHNPLSYFSDVVNSSTEKYNLVPFTQFTKDLANSTLPNFSFIVPNMLHDAHDGTLAQADAWLKTYIAPLISSPTFQRDGMLIIVFDESFNADTAHGGGHISAVVISPKGKTGFRSSTFYQHQSALKTILQALGTTSYPGAAASAPAMADFFGTTTASTYSGVKISSPTAGTKVGSPVHFQATATAPSGRFITTTRIYLDYKSIYSVNGASLNTYLSVASGTHSVIVQAWDNTGTTYKSSETITVN
jgi:acid phosphatase